MQVKALSPKLFSYLSHHSLIKKFTKQVNLFSQNPNHPSLHTEKLEPKGLGLFSFRIDRKYRAVFHILASGGAEIIDINDHYQ